jgi:hypothetical protein
MFGTGVLRVRSHGHGLIAFAGAVKPESLATKIEQARPIPGTQSAVSNFQLKSL